MRKEKQKPFFAQFLEDQKVNEASVKGGFPPYDVTHKWPSDDDEGGPTS